MPEHGEHVKTAAHIMCHCDVCSLMMTIKHTGYVQPDTTSIRQLIVSCSGSQYTACPEHFSVQACLLLFFLFHKQCWNPTRLKAGNLAVA